MKLLKSLISKVLTKETQGKIVEWINVLGGWKKLESPTLSTEQACLTCGSKEHYAPVIDPSDKQSPKVWICGNPQCVTIRLENCRRATTIPPQPKRAILWPIWCEINDLGNLIHEISFEKIQQSPEKISFMIKFLEKPHNFVLMRGDPGTGKTYASLGMCEFFTRKSLSCVFFTQKRFYDHWYETTKSTTNNIFLSQASNSELLVIDDFGTAEVTPGFMTWFMDLLNRRMQWNNRGTVITTNLSNKKLVEYCGQALTDRLNTGQLLEFTGTSRRKQTPL